MFLEVHYFLQWNRPFGYFLYLSLFFLSSSLFLSDLLYGFNYSLYDIIPKFLFPRQTSCLHCSPIYLTALSVSSPFVSQAPQT